MTSACVVGMPCGKPRICLQGAVLNEFHCAWTRAITRDDLIGFTVHREDGDADLLEILGVVLADERGDTLVLALSAAHHALAPRVPDDRLGRLNARLVKVIERS
jgi:hypothetical protein